jgi:hypothetical protein
VSIGHRAFTDEELTESSIGELYSALGVKDTPFLFGKPYKLDTDHDIPIGGGNSLDRRTKYIDRILYQEVMDGQFKATDLTPEQIIERWLDHEHSEKCMVDGDNGIDNYLPGHRRALRKEHEGIIAILGPKDAAKKIKKYEETIWPGLVRCYHRDIVKPPKDLWCAPLLDQPSERDEEILAVFRKLGVVDASKRPKYAVHYGFGPKNCDQCAGWNPELVSQEHGELAGCHRVSGLVRADRHCDAWRPK